MSPARPPLHTVLPPLVLGTATFNTQYVSDPFALPASAIVSRALDLGVRAFDTSPYYGPSESILGAALSHPSVTSRPGHARSSYFLITKVGRVAGGEFDYTAAWVRYSVYRSLERLVPPGDNDGEEEEQQGRKKKKQKRKLDLVYLHDVEFVSPGEVVTAARELMRLRDEEGVIDYVGISGYPVEVLCSLAELVYRTTGTPLDAVLSYCHFSVQNTALGSAATQRRLAEDARVDVVLNASMLGMGLLTTRGAGAGPIAAWHPAPEGLRAAAHALAPVAEAAGEKLEVVAIRWALDNWARVGAARGAVVAGEGKQQQQQQRVGVSVMGISSVAELEETVSVFRSVMDGLLVSETPESESDEDKDRRAKSLERRDKIQGLVEKMWEVLGRWKDYSWSSPEPGFVNARKPGQMGVVPDDGIFEKHSPVRLKVEEVPAEEPAVQG
ncbi:L-galactose dehydrogenase [Biscogniauxia mediterranea]|nr:L-galactose dehydrogenase [Biscogniauxia mediterranea]